MRLSALTASRKDPVPGVVQIGHVVNGITSAAGCLLPETERAGKCHGRARRNCPTEPDWPALPPEPVAPPRVVTPPEPANANLSRWFRPCPLSHRFALVVPLPSAPPLPPARAAGNGATASHSASGSAAGSRSASSGVAGRSARASRATSRATCARESASADRARQ